ncbi:hypothetical protein YPPY60_0681, partial [Yersinia pestis PY-60]
MPSSDCN